MILAWLAFLERHGPALMAAGLAVGILWPDLAHLLRPTLPAMVFLITLSAFLMAEPSSLVAHARRLGRMGLLSLWLLIATPLMATSAAGVIGLDPALTAALVLWSGAPPLSSAPAIAALIGLDAALALLAVIFATFAVPFTLPPLALGLIGLDLGIGVLPLMTRLALFTGGAGLAALLIRRLAGTERLRRGTTVVNGLNVVLLHLFAIAAMDGVRELMLSAPQTVLIYAATTLSASLVLQAFSLVVFAWTDRPVAATIGLLGGNRNMAVVWANLGSAATPELMLFFALMQVPIYALPILLAPAYRRIAGTGAGLTDARAHATRRSQ